MPSFSRTQHARGVEQAQRAGWEVELHGIGFVSESVSFTRRAESPVAEHCASNGLGGELRL